MRRIFTALTVMALASSVAVSAQTVPGYYMRQVSPSMKKASAPAAAPAVGTTSCGSLVKDSWLMAAIPGVAPRLVASEYLIGTDVAVWCNARKTPDMKGACLFQGSSAGGVATLYEGYSVGYAASNAGLGASASNCI